jgi:RimJ/RimL family protein N-acetyltransferase
MTAFPELSTARLRLRAWRDSDLPAYAALNADPQVMAHMPAVFDRAASDASAAYIAEHFARHGFGLWAVEVPDVADFIGFVGLAVPGFQAHFTPCVEIGWRLAHAHWGHGYATEAAEAAADFAFGPAGLAEIVSFTVPDNTRSRAVMERLGMTHDAAEDFDHPRLPEGHPLRRHVLYRLRREVWLKRRRAADHSGDAGS